MELTAYFDQGNKVIVVESVGEVNTENIKATATKALELSKQHNNNLLLFDITKCSVGQSATQGFQDMQNMSETTGLTLDYKSAIVYDPNIYPTDRARFIENVVFNRGNQRFKVFTDRHEALKWLKKD